MNDRPHVALIGDLIGSRKAKNRDDLQQGLQDALRWANSILIPAQKFEPTVGDEFQGVFSDVNSAVRATLLLRLHLLRERDVDARFGLGFGEVTVFESRTPISQDGPGWWAARAAIERINEQSRSGRTGFVRTHLESFELRRLPRGEVAALNAFLFCRDALVAQMRPRTRRLLLGMLLDRPQAELAAEEGISQSAVSQNLVANGAYAIKAAEVELNRKLL
jgi:hypothetical protein